VAYASRVSGCGNGWLTQLAYRYYEGFTHVLGGKNPENTFENMRVPYHLFHLNLRLPEFVA